MARNRSTKSRRTGIGAGYLLKLTIGISLLMIVNCYLVGILVQANLQYIPQFFHDVRLYQFCQIFVSFVLVLIQFWIYDRMRYRMSESG